MRSIPLVPLLVLAVGSPAQDDAGQPAVPLFGPQHVAAVPWRTIGPANMGGRVTDIEIVRDRPATMYLATAGGGVWKTRNAGTTWEALFHDQPTASIGDVAVAPSNPDIVWVGTGEENARNSVSWGDGIYRSLDGGQTWRHMGLGDAFQIGHIAIHPHTADVVFVAALGTLWGPNTERGVFRTRDGGESWDKVLYADEWTGCMDVRIDPAQPNNVYAALYERARDEFDSNDPAVRFGSKSGFFRSIDGGDTWTKLTDGLPTCRWGRSALAIWDKDPQVLFAVIETERSGWATGDEQWGARSQRPERGSAYMGINSVDGEDGARLTSVTAGGPSAKAGLQVGDTIVQIDDTKIASRNELFAHLSRASSGDKVAVQVRRAGGTVALELTFGARPGTGEESGEGGPGGQRGGNGPNGGRMGGQSPNIQDQQGERGFETGGVFRSADRGQTWTRVNSLTERPFYYSKLAVDPQDENNLYLTGVQFYASRDGGKTFRTANRSIHVDFHAIVVDPSDSDHLLLAGDGGLNVTWNRGRTWEVVNNFAIGQFYHADVDNSVPYRVYGGLQDNGTWGGPSRTRSGFGMTRDDWVQIYGGDGFVARVDPETPHIVYATSQNGRVGQVDLRTGATSMIPRPRAQGLEFNWDTPFFLSPHDPRILYLAGNQAIRHWVGAHQFDGRAPRAERSELLTETPLGLTDRGTATAMAESPVRPGLLWVGTDDGALWRSGDGGRTWTELHAKLTSMPGPRYVSSIHPSRFDVDRVYVTFDGHRSNDFAPYVYVTHDMGESWQSIANDLPAEPIHVCREDQRNQDLLLLGTEFGCHVSLDRGAHWLTLGTGLPTVAVRDLVIHDRDAELVAATHGRGIWIADIAPLREMTDKVAESDVHLFAPQDAILWRIRRDRPFGDKEWVAENPPTGATFYAYFANTPAERPTLTVHDIAGEQVASLDGQRAAGLQRFQWSARTGSGRFGRTAAPGSYSVRLEHGDRKLARAFRLLPDPDPAAAHPAAASTPSSAASASRKE
jgi:photosystem II stability/assembly factor-like uncharacterized protein